MCNAYNHDDSCDCGWGGVGYRGTPAGAIRTLRISRSDQHPHFDTETRPSKCPICGDPVFFHSNGNGDAVYFDELGPPWPKHACFEHQPLLQTAEQHGLSDIYSHDERPTSLELYGRRSITERLASRLAMSRSPDAVVAGVVSRRDGWSGRIAGPNKPMSTMQGAVGDVLTIASKTRLMLDVYFGMNFMRRPVGQIMRVECTSGSIRDMGVLVATGWTIIDPCVSEEPLPKCTVCGRTLFARTENQKHWWCDCQAT